MQPVCVNSTVTTTSTLKMTPTGGPAPTVTMTKTLTQTPTCAGQTTATERCTADFGVFTKFDVVTYTDTTSETTEFSTGTTVRSAWSPIYTGIYNTWTDTLYSTSTISTSYVLNFLTIDLLLIFIGLIFSLFHAFTEHSSHHQRRGTSPKPQGLRLSAPALRLLSLRHLHRLRRRRNQYNIT